MTKRTRTVAERNAELWSADMDRRDREEITRIKQAEAEQEPWDGEEDGEWHPRED